MRHTNRHIQLLGADLGVNPKPIKEGKLFMDYELVILRKKRLEWERSGTELSFEEFIMTDFDNETTRVYIK